MTAVRIIQVSDLHLGSAAGAERQREADIAWTQFADRVRADPPELIVVTGDIVVDDPDFLDDHRYAQERLAELGVATMVLPGNHDVGDHPVRDGLPPDWHGAVVTEERIRQWESLWGPSRHLQETGDWTLIGLNSQLFGSGLPQEQEQWEWLQEHALPRAAHRRCAVFLHEALHLRPEYEDTTPDNGWMSIPAAASERLAATLAAAEVDLVGSGHTHRFAQWRLGGLAAVNAPSLVGPIPVRASMVQPFGDTEPGWVELTLSTDGVEIAHVPRRRDDAVTTTSTSPARRGIA